MKKHGVYREGPETDRMILRAFVPSDAEAFYRLVGDPDIIRYTGEAPPPSVDVCRESLTEYPDWDRYGFGRWACILKETGALVGFCGLKFLEDWQIVDLGYRFVPEVWGRGLATEGSHATMRFGFETLDLETIYGFVDPKNSASVRVLEKMGMKKVADVDYDGLAAWQYAVTEAEYWRFVAGPRSS